MKRFIFAAVLMFAILCPFTAPPVGAADVWNKRGWVFFGGGRSCVLASDYGAGFRHDRADVHGNIGSWDAAMKHLSPKDDNTIDLLVLSGHGSREGGVATKDPNTYLDFPRLKEEHVLTLRKKIAPKGVVLVLGCESGKSSNLQQFSTAIGRRIIANLGDVTNFNEGEGDWVLFHPNPNNKENAPIPIGFDDGRRRPGDGGGAGVGRK